MDAVWYYALDSQQVGPVPFAELKALADAGKLTPDALVWKDGTPDWVAARTVPDLFPPGAADATYVLDPSAPAPRPVPPPIKPPLPAEPLPLDLDDEPPLAPKPRKKRRPDDRPRDPDAPGGELPPWAALGKLLFLRAVNPDPATAAPNPDEAARLSAAGVTDPTARNLAVWRRSVLLVAAVPCALAALFGLINLLAADDDEHKMLSSFGLLLLYVQALSVFALPAAAVLAALAYDRLSASMKWVLAGGLVSFAVPLLVAFVPTDWLLDLKADKKQTVAEAEMARTVMGLAMGLSYYITLTPAVLSLLPAVSRACVRTKLFLPESLVPGWGLVTSVPLCVLLTLATFVVVYHTAGNGLLILGLLLWVGAPLAYFTRLDLLTRPTTRPADRAALTRTALLVFGLTVAGAVLLTVYGFTAKFFGRPILGFDKEAVARPWSLDLTKTWLEYIGRSLFLTVFFADLLVRIALSVWREERAFAGTDAAPGFDRTMSGLGAAVLPRPGKTAAGDESGE